MKIKNYLLIPIGMLVFFLNSCQTGRLAFVPTGKRIAQKQFEKVENLSLEQKGANSEDLVISSEDHRTELVVEDQPVLIEENKIETNQFSNERNEVNSKIGEENSNFSSSKVEAKKKPSFGRGERTVTSGLLIILAAILLALLAWVFFVHLGIVGLILAYIFWIMAAIYFVFGVIVLLVAL